MNAAPTAQAALAELIERHRAAYNALSRAIDDHEDERHHPAVDAAIDADEDALFELCAYRCESIQEASAKAVYLLTTVQVRDDMLSPEHIRALLESLSPPEPSHTAA